jgi:hypothetical protein
VDKIPKGGGMKNEHLNYFNDTVSMIKRSVNVIIPILPADHEQIKGHKEALGICHGYKNTGKNNWKPEKITIDEYFIEECYEAEINGKWYFNLTGQNLVEVICHEIAHICEWRHGKKHGEITQWLIGLVNAGMPCDPAQREEAA